jgi:RHS repeat-associated protein
MNSLERGARRAGAWWAVGIVMLTLSNAPPDVVAETLQYRSYDYDGAGNLAAIADPIDGNQSFIYDDLDRLGTANGAYGTYIYDYDEIGNLKKNPQVSPNPYVYPSSGANSVRPHAVTTAGANSYTYDANGNMLTGAGRTYTWNQENKPLTIVQGGTTTTFVYDGKGGRVKKIVGATTTRYITKLYECDNTSCTRFIYAGSQRIATVASNGAVHYWHPDHLGSSSMITDSTGAKVQALTYYPYGTTRTNLPGTPVNVPYKYTGKELDASTGLYYYEARYYDPTLGRFISADTIVPHMLDPQSLNRYTYTRNNPLIYTDPTGHFFGGFFEDLFDSIGDLIDDVFTDIFKPFNEIGKMATHVWENPLKAISPMYWVEVQYRMFMVSNPLLQVGLGVTGLDNHVDAAVREYQRFENSRTGRYIDGGIIVAGSIIASIYCGGCLASATIPYLTASVSTAITTGAAIGATLGYAQAVATGGDPFNAAALGGIIGAGSGFVTAGVGGYLHQFIPKSFGGLPFTQAGVSGFAGDVVGGAFGGGLNSAAAGTNIGKGIGFGALGSAIGSGMQNTQFSGFKYFYENKPWQVIGDGTFDWTGERLTHEIGGDQ